MSFEFFIHLVLHADFQAAHQSAGLMVSAHLGTSEAVCGQMQLQDVAAPNSLLEKKILA